MADPIVGRPIRWGILSTGHMAEVMTEDLGLVEDCEVVAVASRDADRAAAFAQRYGIARSHGSYADLAADDEVDVVFVATPHNDHLASATLCLEAGKAVLCEKPLTVTPDEAVRLVAAARDNDRFCMEAVWARANTLLVTAARLVAEGAIGPVRQVQAALGFRADVGDEHRLLNPDLAGGAILDMGLYPVHAANLFLGEPDEVLATGLHHPRTGVDTHATAILVHHATDQRPAAHAVAHTSLVSGPANRLEVVGENGRLVVDGYLRTSEVRIERPGQEVEVLTYTPEGHGYLDQLREVNRCLREGLTESPLVPLESSLQVMRTLDRWRTAVATPSQED